MSKRKQSDDRSLTDTITIHDIQSGHNFFAPYEYSPVTIGIHNYMVRYCENEQFIKFFYQGVKTGLQTTKDFIAQLNHKEKTLSNKCNIDIERCAMITRLRKHLEQDDESFQNILNEIKKHLYQSMQENAPLSPPKNIIELAQQCNQRNEAAMKLQQAYRMRRLQFHDNNDTKQSMNIINLQEWTLAHFRLFSNIIPKVPNRIQLIPYLETLINNSFIIIQHPSSPITTHSTGIKDGITAKMHCRLLCLLDRSNPVIKINNIIPIVRRLITYYQTEEPDTGYQQPQMQWKNYSIITSSNNYKIFSCADLSEISLKQTFTASSNQKLPAGRTHYAPLIYRIDFCISVTVHFLNDPSPYRYCVTLQSAPFGLISNTSQEEDLFARVFMEDLKSWRLAFTTGLDNISSPPTTTNLIIEQIVDSIERYFIHKTGIRPRDWVMSYIGNILGTACYNQPGSIESLCHIPLVRILAQIDFMSKHPLLSLFHADGLFLAICDSETVRQILFDKRKNCQKSICAIRFGAINRMSNLKNIGVRVDLAENSSSNVQQYKLDTANLPYELGLFIIKIALCEASHFNSILASLYTNVGGYDGNSLENITKFIELYHSEKLLEICPHEIQYASIWNHFHNNENKDPNNSHPSIASSLSSNCTIAKTTGATVDNNNLPYNPWHPSLCTIDQTSSQPYQSQHQIQFQETHANVPQYSITPQINQININPPPIIIVVTSPNQCIMSNQDLTLLVEKRLPEYAQLIHSSPIHRIDADETFSPNSTSFDDLDFLFN